MVDDVAQRNDGEGHTRVSTLNDGQDMGSPGLVNCPNGTEEISLWASVDNSQDFHVEHGTMTILLVAGTGAVVATDVLLLDGGADKLLLDDGASFLLIRP